MLPPTTYISVDDVISLDSITANGKKASLIDPINKKQVARPCGLPSREREQEELGEETRISDCFACNYIGESESGAIPMEGISALMTIIKTSIAHCDPIALCKYVAQRYLLIQEDVNSHLQPGERPLPDWPESMVLKHLRDHNLDPVIQHWFRARELQELMGIALHASVEVDPMTGEKTINEKQGKMWIAYLGESEKLAKTDFTKKAFHSGDAYLDHKIASQGAISVSGKPLVSYLRNLKRQKH